MTQTDPPTPPRGGPLPEGVLVPPGEPFFRWLVRHLQATLGVEHAFIGELCGADWERVRTLAVCSEGEPGPAFEYDLRDTPCADVLQGTTCCIPSQVAQRYPGDALLVEMGVEGYAGLPLRDASGLPLGLVVVLRTEAMADSERVLRELERFAPRAASELEQHAALRDLQTIAAAALPASEEQTLAWVVESLARSLRVRMAFIGEHVGADRIVTRAIHGGGSTEQEIEYTLEGTPCEAVYREGRAFFPDSVQQHFPGDHYLQECGAESYMGVLLRSSAGDPIGHLGILHDRPLHERMASSRHFRVLAARATAELERLQAEAHRREVDRKLVEAQKTESLAVLAGGVAHDLNNLLVGVLGNANLALIHLKESSPAPGYVREIELASRSAADLAKQLLAYSGRARFQVQPVDLGHLVRGMGDLLASSIPKNVELRFEHEPDLPSVEVDMTQMRQVVMNLVLNGAEAIGRERGTVRVSMGRIQVGSDYLNKLQVGSDRPPGPFVFLSVQDTGCGMDAETRRRLFDPFFSTKFAGRGLGLAAVQGIVRGHGGALDVRSTPGRGSTFELLLPSSEEPVLLTTPEEEQRASRLEARGSGTILVVDDEAAVRATTKSMVEHLGFEALALESGQEALQALVEMREAVLAVLLDVTMPQMSGQETLQELLRQRPDLRVVMMSGYDEQEASERFAGQGLAGFLQKPFSLSALGEALQGTAD